MFQQVDYVMVIVSDMSRSVEFYRDKLGLPLKFETNEWTEFQTGPTILALHGGGTSREKRENNEGQVAGSCSIGFTVKDLDKTYAELKEKGVRFVMPPTQREGEGIKLAVGLDPDGLPVSFAENLG
jgi:lactoylglutathione lyase